MGNLCIIPARGGSKRIPRKNIRPFLGKPIIAYSIHAAIASRLFDHVMVSTDDLEIAEMARVLGAQVPFIRSTSNASDYATLSDVIEEVKESYKRKNVSFEYICCLLPTAPFVNSSLLEMAYKKLINSEADSIRPIVRYSYPIQRSLKMSDDGYIELVWPDNYKARSQDLETRFHDSGQFYWMKSDSGLLGSKKLGLEIPESLTQDIDSLEDWKLAEMKYKIFTQQDP